jgi:hypothetical protein
MVAMTPVLLHRDQPGFGRPGQMPSRGLRRYAGSRGQFPGRQRTTIHQRIEHVRPAGIADQRPDLRQSGLPEHGRGPNAGAILESSVPESHG